MSLDNVPPGPEPRELTDATTMRALAHPVRLALLEALARKEPLTATEAAEMIGESPTNCAFHFRTLAKYGFVEEAGDAPGRRRPWRRKHIGFQFGFDDDPDSAATDGAGTEAELAGEALASMLWQTWLRRLALIDQRRTGFDRDWQRVTSGSESALYMTVDEAADFLRELNQLFLRHRDRLGNAALRPEGAMPVEFVAFTYPAEAIELGER